MGQICNTCGRYDEIIYGTAECWTCHLKRIKSEMEKAAPNSADKAQEEQEE